MADSKRSKSARSQHQSTSTAEDLADDLLTGAAAIGAFLGWPRRRVYYAAERHYLPIRRIGDRLLVARRSELAAAIDGHGEAA
jgi:hypothetical protein